MGGAAEPARPPVMLMIGIGPQGAQTGGQHFFGEQLDVLHHQVAREGAEAQHGVEVADAVFAAEVE